MTLFPAIVLVSVLAGYASRGRLRTLERLRLRWWALAPIGLTLQLAPAPALGGDAERLAGEGLLVASYLVLLAFVARNFPVVGAPTIFLGLALNLAVIAVNGGMPVSEGAVVKSGQADTLAALSAGEDPKHHLQRPDDDLMPLADVIPVGRPFRQVVSLGDLVIYTGTAALLIAAMRGRTPGLALPLPEPPPKRGRVIPATEWM